jgi:predicted dinucleotide-binding enzyme
VEIPPGLQERSSSMRPFLDEAIQCDGLVLGDDKAARDRIVTLVKRMGLEAQIGPPEAISLGPK